MVVPLVLPDWLQGDKLGRVIIGFAPFFAAYQAEIICAGPQSIPDGQVEAAVSPNIPFWPQLVNIQLPQAFRNTLPFTINQAVITIKETLIVTIIGFFEVMASGNAVVGTAEWGQKYVEVYLFLAFIYFIFVFGLPHYGAWLETRMRLGHC